MMHVQHVDLVIIYPRDMVGSRGGGRVGRQGHPSASRVHPETPQIRLERLSYGYPLDAIEQSRQAF